MINANAQFDVLISLYMGHYQKMEKSVSFMIFWHPQLPLSSFFLSIKLNDIMCNMNKILCTASGDVV